MNPIEEIEKCVWCGFCESVCPTYLADRRRYFGPRGRLIAAKKVFLNNRSLIVSLSIETCLLCRACNLICPVDIDIVEVIRSAKKLLNA